MPIEDKKTVKPKLHNIVMENRERMNISGVVDVDSFNEESVIIQTEMGLLAVRGMDLHISKLNLESSELVIEGDIVSCVYSDKDYAKAKGMGILSRIFR